MFASSLDMLDEMRNIRCIERQGHATKITPFVGMQGLLRTNGKPGKVAVIAVANKLVRPAFAVVTHERPYVDGYVSTIDSAETSLGVEG